jgi:hypothetical protein
VHALSLRVAYVRYTAPSRYIWRTDAGAGQVTGQRCSCITRYVLLYLLYRTLYRAAV